MLPEDKAFPSKRFMDFIVISLKIAGVPNLWVSGKTLENLGDVLFIS